MTWPWWAAQGWEAWLSLPSPLYRLRLLSLQNLGPTLALTSHRMRLSRAPPHTPLPQPPAPVPALTSKDGETQAEAEDDHVSMERQLCQRGWGQRMAQGHKAQRTGAQAPCHVDDLLRG